ENRITTGQYLGLYKSGDTKTKLLSEAFETTGRDPELPNAVAATLAISFDMIKKRSPRAAEILSLMTFLDRQSIPKLFLKRKNEDDKSFELMKALGTLKAFSLVIETEAGNTFDVHRLVQLVMREWLIASGEIERWAGQA